MKRLTLIIATALMMTACASPVTEGNDKEVPAIDKANFDEAVNLKDNFYQWATGGWQKANPLKPEYSRYGSFDVLRENNEIRINELFEAMTKSTAKAGSIEQKISDLYKMGLDEERLNKEGAEPIREALNEIMAVTEREQVIAMLAKLHTDGIGVFFASYPAADLADSNMTILYMEQGGLGMGNRDYYIDEKNADKKAAYRTYLEKVFTLAGVEGDIKKMVEDVVALEDRIAEKSWSNVECRDIQKGYNPFTYADFKAQFPGVEWDNYFAAFGLKDIKKLVVSQPSSFTNILEVLNTADIAALRAYVAAHYINAASSYLSEEFALVTTTSSIS